MSNAELLRQMMAEGRIRLCPAPILDSVPAQPAGGVGWDRVEGMLLGLAIGDSLGNTTEGQVPGARQAWFGRVTDYLPNEHADGRRVGLPSDDTQFAFWTLERLIEDEGLAPNHLADQFCRERIFGIGSAEREFLRRYKQAHLLWHDAGTESAGNGALVRIAPVLVPHLRRPSTELWADAALAGMVTHNDFASNAACVAFVALLWDLLSASQPPEPAWWLERFVAVCEPLEGDTSYRPRIDIPYVGSLSGFCREKVRAALDRRQSALDACNSWYSGAYLLETVPSVLYILAQHGHDPERAIVVAVNDTKDNDTIAAIVGAAVGALHGKSALPQRWLDGLLGRTGTYDDGRIFQLLDDAKALWGPVAAT